ADAGGPGTGVPAPHHLLNIITNVLESQGAKLGRAAEVYAKTGIAEKDGTIITFRSKYTYNLLRPVTYIQRLIDPTWLPYLVTPPYPEYPSGLMAIIAPVAQVLIREFGDIAVTDDTYSWRGLAPRQYASLSQMSEEAALSRVYAGIHFRSTQYASIDLGKQLGNVIANINLVPQYSKY
ncbi:MAG: vanadium-dependent haloperoxidase, partial [Bacteroidota bacterium]|nr:vanadium-dependent haloperoxidase [Bacteroidota bacterium]